MQVASLASSASTRRATAAAHAAFVPTGTMTVLLGPLLPTLSERWSLNDSQAGELFFAQFLASTFGVMLSGALVSRIGYRFAIVLGLFFLALGAGILPFLGWPPGLMASASWGIGIGLTIPACNLLIAAVHPESRASALNLLNFSWSLGAVACPFLLAPFQRARAVNTFLFVLGGVILLIAAILAFIPLPNPEGASANATPGRSWGVLLAPTALVLAALFFLYTGTENAVGGWLASYAKRSAAAGGTLWVTTPSFFYVALLCGRAGAPLLLRKMSEVRLARGGLVVALLGVVALLASDSIPGIFASAAVIGLGLAAVYPITISLMSQMAGAAAAQVGSVMFALAGVGAACVPWLVGVGSNQFSSLKYGLVVPLAGCALMLGLYLRSWEAAPEPATGPPKLVH